MPKPIQQQTNKQDTADDANDQLDGQLVGIDHNPPDHIADQHERCTKQSGIHQRSADLVTLEHCYDIGHDEADVGDRADHDNIQRMP